MVTQTQMWFSFQVNRVRGPFATTRRGHVTSAHFVLRKSMLYFCTSAAVKLQFVRLVASEQPWPYRLFLQSR